MLVKMPGAKRKKLEICSECKHATKPAINAAKLGHAQCLTTAYRDLGAFNERDDFGATPIHFAARFGKLECLQWLVSRSGVSPNAVSRNGATAAHDAAAMGHQQCLEYLLQNTKCSVHDTTSEGATVLHMACRFGRLDVVKWLMEFSKATPGEKGANNVTPVHLCAAKNHLECLRYLTEHPGYVPNEQTVHGATPLYFAAQEGCLEAMVWLAENGGADLYLTATDGMAAIHAAAQAGQTACLEWLVEKGGVSIRHKAEDGATPAHFAAASGQTGCLNWIIDHGGSFYDRDNLGGTPAHDAAEQGQITALKLLLDHGVDMETVDLEGMKPLDLARSNNHEECVQLLFKTIKPSILESLTPHQSLSRGASRANDEATREQAEKQRVFEEAMLSGVSEEKREAIWQSAQQRATSVQPGLKMILDGESAASPSSLSLEGHAHPPPTTSSIQLSPVGSMRHSRHTSVRGNSNVAMDFIPDDPQTHKPRPPLSSELFQYPLDGTGVSQPSADAEGHVESAATSKSPAKKAVSPPDKKAPPTKQVAGKRSTSPSVKKVPASSRRAPKRATSPPPKKIVKKTSPPPKPVREPTSLPPKTVVRRPTSPPPKGAKRPTSHPPKGAKRPTSPPPKGAKRPTSPPPKGAKRPTSPPPKGTKRPTSPPPKGAKRPTSPPPKGTKRPTSPPPKGAKRPTSPPPKGTKRPTSPPPKGTKRPTSPPPKGAKRPTSPPPKGTKRPTFPPPKGTKRPTSPPPKGTKRPTSHPPKGTKRPTSPPPKGAKRPTSYPPKGAKRSNQSAGVRQERGRPRDRAPEKVIISSLKQKASSEEQIPQASAAEGNKSEELAAVLDNVPESTSITAQLTNRKIELVLNESLLQPGTIPTTVGPQLEGGDGKAEKTQVEGIEEGKELEQFAEKMVDDVVKESLLSQDKLASAVSNEEPPSLVKQSAPTVTDATPVQEVVLRKSVSHDRPRVSSFKEEAVISKPPLRQSLKTGDETVTVTFVTKSSHIKKPFPVTHHQLLTGDDLESPGVSDDEGAQRESFTVPGFDRLDSSNFDSFGSDIKSKSTDGPTEVEKNEVKDVTKVLDLDEGTASDEKVIQQLSDELDDGEEAPERQSDGQEEKLEEQDKPLEGAEKPQEGEMEELSKEQELAEAELEGDRKEVSAESAEESQGLSRWNNEKSLDKIDQLSRWTHKEVMKKTEHPKDTYNKLQDFESQRRERGYTGVLRMVDSLQGNGQAQTSDEAPRATGQTGSGGRVNDRLKMFGGGAAFIKPPPPQKPRSETTSSTGGKEAWSKPVVRRSSSCLSVTAFETIAEESASGGESDEPPEKSEGSGTTVPPPAIQPSLSRRQSEEKLRLDGLKITDRDNISTPSSANRNSSPTLPQRRNSGTAVYSPLMVSSSPKPHKNRPASMPPSPPKGSEDLALFMSSANLPHLEHLRERNDREEARQADKRVALLTAPPTVTADKVPLEFRTIDFQEKDKLYVWKQKAGSLTRLSSLDSLNFDPKAVFLFLHTPSHGPLLHHVYVWVGAGVSHFAVQSAYQHCMRLVQCTPGRPLIHKEFQGHESIKFSSALRASGKALSEFHQPYLNSSLRNSRLLTFKDSSFKKLDNHKSLSGHGSPVILDTAVGLWVWLPAAYWGGQSPLEISELYITRNNYPKWTPVTVVTEGIEAQEFTAHFSWPWVDLARGQRSAELHLPVIQPPAVTYPATGQINVWQLQDGQLVKVPLTEMGQFRSNKLYIVQYSYLKQSPLYTWMEGCVYLWVGGAVEDERAGLIDQALLKLDSATPTKLPVVVVPEGQEPIQLLNLFKGKFIVHGPLEEGGTRLYRVCGSSGLTMKATQVTATASSLHSSHAFILSGHEGVWSVWAGQFSSQAERRGALIIAKTLTNKQPIKLAEGLETEGFWAELGRKGKYSHFDSPTSPAHIRSHFYLCHVTKETVLFQELLPMCKEELRPSHCYLLSYKEQVFMWMGVEWKSATPPLSLARTYLHQYHSYREEKEFVVTMVTGGNEGEMFWKWFAMQNPGASVAADSAVIEAPASPAVESLEKSDSMVVVEDVPESDTVSEPMHDPIPETPAEPSTSVKIASILEPTAVVTSDNSVPDSTRPLSLTPSQEATIERVQKLQSELTDLVERGASEGSGGSEGSGASEGSGGSVAGGDEPDGEKRDDVETSPLRTSAAIHQMSEMINGLDDMLKSSRGDVQATPTLESAEPSVVSLQVPSVSNLMETAEDDNLKAPPVVKKNKKQPSSPPSAPPPSILVRVEIESKGRTVEVRVREKAPVITLMFRAARAAGTTLTTNSALFEVVNSLKLYRALEDHELIKDVMALWPKKDKPKLLLKEFATKNTLWGDTPPLTHRKISAYLKGSTVPSVSSRLQYSHRGAGRPPWKEGTFTLRTLGIYTVTQSKKKGTEVNLATSLDHVIYIPLVVEGKSYTTPTPYCFVMKPPNSWHEKDLTFYCASSLPIMSKWIHVSRLFKHGIQLKANFVAMKTKVSKQRRALSEEH